MKTIEMTTCKLVFEYGVITEDGVRSLLLKHTKNFEIHNFYADREIGCNRISFAVIDVPQKLVSVLYNEKIIKEIDPMSSSGVRSSNAESCDPGHC